MAIIFVFHYYNNLHNIKAINKHNIDILYKILATTEIFAQFPSSQFCVFFFHHFAVVAAVLAFGWLQEHVAKFVEENFQDKKYFFYTKFINSFRCRGVCYDATFGLMMTFPVS